MHGVGKIRDIFAGYDIDHSHTTRSNVEGITQDRELLRELDDGFVFTNLVETDMLWGHRNDPVNFHRCLQDFDRRLPGSARRAAAGRHLDPHVRSRMRPDDAVDRPLARARAAARRTSRASNAAGQIHEGEFADVGATVNAWLGGKAPGRKLPGRADRRIVRLAHDRDPPRRADRAQARRRGARARGADGAHPRARERRDPRLPAGRLLHGRVLPRDVDRRDVRDDRRDGAERRHARPARRARPSRRRQALDRGSGGQDVDPRRARSSRPAAFPSGR